MNTSPCRLLGVLAVACAAPAVHAEDPPAATPALYSGLTITGTPGNIVTVEASSDLGSWSVVGAFKLKPGQNQWFDAAAPIGAKRFYRSAVVSVEPATGVVWIDPGSFVMGSADTEAFHDVNEGPQTSVTISKGFYMGKYEVTQAEYFAVTGLTPSAFTGDDSRPVDSVTWQKAVLYCATLTDSERAAGRIPATWSYRLPTEAEWEYACRAGTTTAYSFGDDSARLGEYAWWGYLHPGGNSGGTTHPVGQKLPNPWGLYDMHGNIREWCQDLWDLSFSYPGGSVSDPLVTTGPLAVVRGGLWGETTAGCRSAKRVFYLVDLAGNNFGFRVVLAPGE